MAARSRDPHDLLIELSGIWEVVETSGFSTRYGAVLLSGAQTKVNQIARRHPASARDRAPRMRPVTTQTQRSGACFAYACATAVASALVGGPTFVSA